MGMPYGLQAMLKEGHKHFSGVEEAVMKSVEACKAISKCTRTSLGPTGESDYFETPESTESTSKGRGWGDQRTKTRDGNDFPPPRGLESAPAPRGSDLRSGSWSTCPGEPPLHLPSKNAHETKARLTPFSPLLSLTHTNVRARAREGLNKIIVNHLGKVYITSDAGTILQELEVQHPAAKLLVHAVKAQQQEVGDGANMVS